MKWMLALCAGLYLASLTTYGHFHRPAIALGPYTLEIAP